MSTLKKKAEFNYTWECGICGCLNFISESQCNNADCKQQRPPGIEVDPVWGASKKIADEWNALLKDLHQTLHRAPCGRYLPADGEWTDELVGVEVHEIQQVYTFSLRGSESSKTLKLRKQVYKNLKKQYAERKHDLTKVGIGKVKFYLVHRT